MHGLADSLSGEDDAEEHVGEDAERLGGGHEAHHVGDEHRQGQPGDRHEGQGEEQVGQVEGRRGLAAVPVSERGVRLLYCVWGRAA